jgi:hypothetical protein
VSAGEPDYRVVAIEKALWDVTEMITAAHHPMTQACRISAGPSQPEWQRYAQDTPIERPPLN